MTIAAPAKINLALHVTGQRDDGYHSIETLAAFAGIGDRITVEAAQEDRFTIDGPFAAGLDAGDGNLVIRARDALRAKLGEAPAVHIHLEKNLPLASGIGGGSADAAAALKALVAHWDAAIAPERLREIAETLGADVPMCLNGRPLVARGVGEAIEPLADFPRVACVLVNPGRPVPTPAVFAALTTRDNAPLASFGDGFDDAETLFAWLDGQRNDLQTPALTLEPTIGEALELLGGTDARIVRMSGSGATCFGLYDDGDAARRAAETLTSARPGWYVQSTHLESSDARD